MKKIYTFLLCMVAALTGAAVANAASITVTVDNPEAVYYTDPHNDYQAGTWGENNSTVFEIDDIYSIPLRANDGYFITKLEKASGEVMFTGRTDQKTLYISDVEDGDVVYITSEVKQPKILKIYGDPEKMYVADDTYQELRADANVDGAWTITVTRDEYGSIYIYAVDGYLITSLKDDKGDSWLYSANAQSAYIGTSSLPYGETTVLYAEAKAKEEIYDGHVTVNVEGSGSDVSFSTADYKYTYLQTGENTVYFDRASAFPITIKHANDYYWDPNALYKVSLNGVELKAVDREYTLESLENGDVIDVVVDAPTADIRLSVRFADDVAREAVEYIKLDGEELDLENCDDIATTTGKKIEFYVDHGNYDVTMTENGEPVEFDYGSYSQKFTDDKGYVYAISAVARQPINFTVVCENYDKLVVSSNYGYIKYPLTGVESAVTVKPTETYITIKAVDGWYTPKIYDLETGNELSSSFTVSEGQTIVVEAEEFLRDHHFMLYTEPDVWNYLTFSLNPDNYDLRYSFDPEGGYTDVAFNYSDRPFGISGYSVDYDQPQVFLNGEHLTGSWGSYPALENVEDGDVIKIMTPDAPLHAVTYTVAEGAEVTVRHDRVRTVDHSAAHSVHTGTEIHIIPAHAGTIAVKAGETELVADEDGKFVHTVTEPVEIVVSHSGSSSILDIEAAADGAVDVYNLQGVCVRKAATAADINTLPAGIYVTTTGKKVVVK